MIDTIFWSLKNTKELKLHKRPNLKEALSVLTEYSGHSADCVEILAEYKQLKENNQEFLAGRLVIDTVDHFYHLRSVA